jgi:hypothetical protein
MEDIERIRDEIDDGVALLERLENDAAVKSELAHLSSEEATAVLEQMAAAVRRETNRGTVWSLAFNLLFFVAGIVVTLLITN